MTEGTTQTRHELAEELPAFALTPPPAPPMGRKRRAATTDEQREPLHRLFAPSDLLHMRSKLGDSSSDCDTKVYKLATQIVRARSSLKFGDAPEQGFFEDVRKRFPHMREPIELFADMAALSKATGTGYHVPPVLLEGAPGVGKTAFAQRLARELGTKMELIDMAGLSAGFMLSGSHPSWQAAKQGRIFDLLTEEKARANPVVVLDELDKVSADKRYDPCGALYTLLEPCSARAFKDEFIPLPIDASAIIWIATCNRAEDVPSPLLSRFDRYYIDYPNAEGWAAIAQSIWADLLEEKPRWAAILAPTLAGNVIARLIELRDAREISRILVRAAARAAKARRAHLNPEDIGVTRKAGKRYSIGFT